MNDQAIENEIQAKGLTAPRITIETIEAEIVDERFFTAAEGAIGAELVRAQEAQQEGKDQDVELEIMLPEPLGLLTFCVLTMRNGFTVVGKSACVSPANFDAALGRRIAREDAINNCWPLLGYQLRTTLMGDAGHA